MAFLFFQDFNTNFYLSSVSSVLFSRSHHIIATIYANDTARLDAVQQQVAAAFTLLGLRDGSGLADDKVFFGYRDSISQPTVLGAPPTKHAPDDQPVIATGEFLLGYTNEIGGSYRVSPSQLSLNGSYAAFRILEQDVAG